MKAILNELVRLTASTSITFEERPDVDPHPDIAKSSDSAFSRSKGLSFLVYVAACLAGTIAVLCLLEGLLAYAHVMRRFFSPRNRWVEVNARYDTELGWVNIPNAYIGNLFGPGVYFRSNSQGFRNNEEFSKEVPAGKFRVICSGDSFTMGSGVDNDQAWCQQLNAFDSRIQPVNMGQGAYGIDQAYLWYERDAAKLDVDLHIFAFIFDDFSRMTFTTHWGYGKPILRLQNGTLATENVPVPRLSQTPRAIFDRLSALKELRTVGALTRVFGRDSEQESEQDSWNRQMQALPLASKVFQDLQNTHDQRKQFFVAVYLPTQPDCLAQSPSDEKLRQAINAQMTRDGILFWDLTDECQQTPGKTVDKMFFGPGQKAQGHLTPEGNRLIAGFLYRRITDAPEIASRLGGTLPAGRGAE